MSRPRLCYVVSSAMTLKAFMLDHLRAAAERYEVDAVAHVTDRDMLRAAGVPVDIEPVAIERRIAPAADLAALFSLSRLFRRRRYDLVHSVTPKAGLLAMLAARQAGVPARLHTFTGQVWAARRGISRRLLKSADRITASCATRLLADSASQREFLLAEGVTGPHKIGVLAHGSVNGVDATRFRPDAEMRSAVRARQGLPQAEVVFLYLGRLTRDKGLIELAQAFAAMPAGLLLLVGPDEENLAAELRVRCGHASSRLHIVGATDRPEEFFAAADVCLLPSHREGFGSVVLEAAAAGVPAIGSRIYGVVDAIVDGVTGLLVAPRDAAALGAAMRSLADDEGLRRRLGIAARERALRDFRPQDLTSALMALYADALRGQGERA